MNPIHLAEFALLAGGDLFGVSPDTPIRGFATDHREARPGDLFLAIRGERVDGHDFAPAALQAGAVAALVERPVEGPHILVRSLVDALANFARARRRSFAGPVIAVTGSNGKTTTKEMIAAGLAPLGPVLSSPGNRNTEYTSPLVWAEVERDHRTAVVEMGMRGFGQIEHLAGFALPTIGVVTTIGTAHIEKVGSRAGIAKAKGELIEALPTDGVAVLPKEDDFFGDLAAKAPNVRTFGTSPDADCRVLGYRMLDWNRSVVRGTLDEESWEVALPVVGRHQALNAAAAILACHTAGLEPERAAPALERMAPPGMRMEIRNVGDCIALVDTYNASPDSTVAALRTLDEGPARARRLAILGEMKELGDFTEFGHRLVGRALAATRIDAVLLTGGPTRWIAEEAVQNGFPSARISELAELDFSAVSDFLRGAGAGDVVLLKASRALGLERALEAL